MNWATPQARDYKGASGRSMKGLERDLPSEVASWRTPRVPTGGLPKEGYKVRPSGNVVQEELGRQVGSGKLNPSWVEQLQGLPVGWTQLSGVTDPNENRIDRLRLLGNGVVEQTAEEAFGTLLGRIIK